MIICRGKGVFKGIAIGKIRVFQKGELTINKVLIANADAEWKRFNEARKIAYNQLKILYDQVIREIGKNDAAIFQIHQMLLEDVNYISSIENIIRTEMVNSEYAISKTTDNIVFMFMAMDNAYIKARAADVQDISRRLITILLGADEIRINSDEPVIIIADDLSPSETVQLDRDKVLAFVTIHGSVNSHTAILARTMNIPSLIGTDIELNLDYNGKMAIVNGNDGTICIEPDRYMLEEHQVFLNDEEKRREELRNLRGRENITLDGIKIDVVANICHAKDVASVVRNDANGIGLFRSEFIFLEKDELPNEEEQFEIYSTVAKIMGKDKVFAIRTIDIGADKQMPSFKLPHEENPAMGLRAIRFYIKYPEVFRTQMRALLRASIYGKVAVIYPLITSMYEVLWIKNYVEKIKNELTEEGYEFDDIEQGIMIETPAAVMISDKLAKEVDFFSIGTNDLSQYTLAADRQNPSIDDYYDPYHIAVLRMIKIAVDNAKKNGIRAGICGELASDPELTGLFLALGVDELSVSPSSVLPVRKTIIETDVSKIKDSIFSMIE